MAPRRFRFPSQFYFLLPPSSFLLTLFRLITVLLAGTWPTPIYNHPSGLYVLFVWICDESMMNLKVHMKSA